MRKDSKIKSTQKWSIISENGKFSIRRWVIYTDGKRRLQRLPIDQYKKHREDKDKLEELCTRLNYREIQEEQAKKAWKVRSAFVDKKHLYDGFVRYMISRIDDRKYANKCVGSLKNWFLNGCTQ